MANDKDKLDLATELVHAGDQTETPTGQPTSTPIYASATFTYGSMEEIDRVFAGDLPGYIYTRYGNPTVTVLEEAIRAAEDGATACAYSSGMAAVHAALFACELTPGAIVLASQDLYGATTNLLQTIFGSFGIKTITADFSDLDGLRAKANEVKPRVLVAETISNPLLKVCDIDACAEIAHSFGARLIVDNTFASPYLCRPLQHGADIVVHSATKFLGGHADAMGGIAVSRDETDSMALIGVMKLVGGVLSPWEAHEILRGIKTLAVRMDRHCENARALATHLQKHPRVGRVYFPGFASAANQDVVKRILRQSLAGALVSIELKDNSREAAFRFMDALKLCVRSTSLGDVFTSMLHPATASHRDLSPARRQQLGITDGLVRISVGIENVNDIIADIEQALEAYRGSGDHTMITIERLHLSDMRKHGERDYPFECCGLLLGRFDNNGTKIVAETYPISNAREEEAKRNRFLIRPEELMRGEKYAREKGFDVVGFYHSHPDDRAVPSKYDLDHAWPTYSYIVVAVEKGRAADLRSWEMEPDRSRFNEEEIAESGRAASDKR